MNDGIDEGFCLFYWRLSWRRKFIRTLWIAGIFIPILVALQLGGALPHVVRNWSGSDSVWGGWAFIGIYVLIISGELLHTWARWQRELRQQ